MMHNIQNVEISLPCECLYIKEGKVSLAEIVNIAVLQKRLQIIESIKSLAPEEGVTSGVTFIGNIKLLNEENYIRDNQVH